MADTDRTEKLTSEIDEGLERDLRDVLGWNDDDSQDDENEGEQTPPADDSPPADESTSEEPQPNTPDNQDDLDPEIDVDGEKFKLSQIRQWRQGHLMLDDYTRKTQALAEERRQLDQQRQLYQQYEQIDAYLRANPHVMDQIRQVLAGQYPAPTQPIPGQIPTRPQGQGAVGHRPPFTPTVPRQQVPYQFPPVPPTSSVPWQGIDPMLDQRLSRIEQSQYDQQLDRTLEQIRVQANAERAKLGLGPLDDAKWQEYSTKLMNEAVTSKTTDLTQVFARDSQARIEWANEAVEEAKQAQRAQQVEQQRKAAGSVMTGSYRGSTPNPNDVTPPKDFQEATRRAYEEIRQAGVSLYSPD